MVNTTTEQTQLTYYGWSSFVIERSGVRLAFDPLYRKLFGGSWSQLHDYDDLQVVCVTHGHCDHLIDVPAIMRHTGAAAVSSAQICAHLEKKYRIPRDRLIPLAPGQQIEVAGFVIGVFAWGHREINSLKLIRDCLLKARIQPLLHFARLHFMEPPRGAPFLGYTVECKEGPRLMNYCEGFNNTTDPAAVRTLGRRYHPDVVLAGAQLDFEDDLANGLNALSPKKAILFHPHSPMFAEFGLDEAPLEAFAARVREVNPSMEVAAARPRQTFILE